MPMPRLSRELPDPSGALSHFPVFFDLTNVPVLVLGSGDLAEAKARLVARSGAKVVRWDRLADGADLTPSSSPPRWGKRSTLPPCVAPPVLRACR